MYSAHSATAVLPLPTSPCNSLFMRVGVFRLAYTSSTAFFWPSVNSKGKRMAKCATSDAVQE